MPPDRTTESSSLLSFQNAENKTLNAQLSLAKEMGFSDEQIWRALERSNKGNKNRAAFVPFISISAMVDALNMEQKQQENNHSKHSGPLTPSDHPLEENQKKFANNDWRSSVLSSSFTAGVGKSAPTFVSYFSLPRHQKIAAAATGTACSSSSSLIDGSAIGRSISFNERGAKGNSTVQRLIHTFETENGRHLEQCHHLRRKLESSVRREREQREQLRSGQERIKELERELQRRLDVSKQLEETTKRMMEELKCREQTNKQQQQCASLMANGEKGEKQCARGKQAEEGRNDAAGSGGNNETAQRQHQAEEEEGRPAVQQMEHERRMVVVADCEDQMLRNLQKEVENLKQQLRHKEELLDAVAGPQLELERLVKELCESQQKCRELVQAQLCGVCMSANREVLFMPCLHFTCCKSCAAHMQHCSMCRLRIMGKIELFQ